MNAVTTHSYYHFHCHKYCAAVSLGANTWTAVSPVKRCLCNSSLLSASFPSTNSVPRKWNYRCKRTLAPTAMAPYMWLCTAQMPFQTAGQSVLGTPALAHRHRDDGGSDTAVLPLPWRMQLSWRCLTLGAALGEGATFSHSATKRPFSRGNDFKYFMSLSTASFTSTQVSPSSLLNCCFGNSA